MAYRSLGELRTELQARLGFGAAGSSGQANRDLLNSFLRDAQWQLYWQAEWPTLTQVADFNIGSGSGMVTYPTEWNMDRVLWIGVNIGTTGSPQWEPMKEGIELRHYNSFVTPAFPARYERRATALEIIPARDRLYAAKAKYMIPLTRFSEDGDPATIDDGIVFLMALANAKGHYRHKDADMYASQLSAVMSRLKGTQWGAKRFLPPSARNEDPMPRPQVV